MKKITTVLMMLVMALFVCGMSVAPVAAEGVIECVQDEDCDNGLGLYCTSKPKCLANIIGLGECVFIDPCQQYEEVPVCDIEADECVECLADIDCQEGREPIIPGPDDEDSDFDSETPFCLEKACVECLEDENCGEGAVCNDENVCIECVDDDDCFDGEFCVEGSCDQCRTADDCPLVGDECVDGECTGSVPCTNDDQCNRNSDYPNTFCDAPGFCNLDTGVCDNASNICEKIWGFPASACVEEDRKCTACLFNDPEKGDTQCENTWVDLSEGNDYPVGQEDNASRAGYPLYGEGVFDNATGPICSEGGDCVECVEDANCEPDFCRGGAGTCNVTEGICEYPEIDPCADNATFELCDVEGQRCVDCLIVPVLEAPVDMVADGHIPGEGEVIIGECPAPDNFCNGTITCNEMGNGECGLSGNPCPRNCLPDSEKCDDCKSDAECVGDDFEGKPICQTSGEFDPDTNSCTECKQDSDCAEGQVCDLDEDYDYTGNTKDPQNDSMCADCLEDADCTDENLPYCLLLQARQPADVALQEGPIVIVSDPDFKTCVECTSDEQCPEDKPECKEIDWDPVRPWEWNPESDVTEINGTPVFECVECDDDRDCRVDSDDIFAPCKLEPTCSIETDTCEYTNPCGDKACYPAGYYDEPGEQNILSPIGKVGFDYFCTDCLNDDDCDDGQFCNGAETCTDGACAEGAGDPCAEGQLCDESADECLDVECLEDADCEFFEECNAQNECDATEATCGLKISPKKLKADKIVDGKQKLTIKGIKGQADFDANGEIYLGEQIAEVAGSVTVKKDKRKSRLIVAPGEVLDEGTILTIRLGDCEGTIELK